MDVVSIIIPVYNCEKYIFDCLKSVENQTYKNIEVIIINDGSKDNSIKIIDKFLKKNKKWILINQLNQGLSVARNNGMMKSSGKYIFFLDGDDIIAPNAIDCLVNSASITKSDIIIGKMINFNSKGEFNNYTTKKLKKMEKFNYKDYKPVLSFIHAAGKLYCKEAINNIEFIPNVKHEDNYFNLKLYFNNLSISMITDNIYYHRIREGNDKSITQSLNETTFKDLLINYNKLIDEINLDFYTKSFLLKKMYSYLFKYIKKSKLTYCFDLIDDFILHMEKVSNKTVVLTIMNYLFRTFICIIKSLDKE